MRGKKGITLIALIITIIVMLILVSVTISIAVNGGLFGYAGRAAKETENEKNKELSWLNIGSNMTTDQLIAKYTTESTEELEFLRQVLPYWYELPYLDNMTAEVEEMVDTFEADLDNEEAFEIINPLDSNFGIIKYHDTYYKVVIAYTNDEPTSLTVVPYILNEKEEFCDEMNSYLENGEAQEYGSCYIYNNSIYIATASEETIFGVELQNLGQTNEISVVYYGNNYLVISPTENLTWSSWASTPGTNDLPVGTTTLKEIINGSSDAYTLSNLDALTGIVDYNTNIITGHIYSLVAGEK